MASTSVRVVAIGVLGTAILGVAAAVLFFRASDPMILILVLAPAMLYWLVAGLVGLTWLPRKTWDAAGRE